jgi:hypothetical protein
MHSSRSGAGRAIGRDLFLGRTMQKISGIVLAHKRPLTSKSPFLKSKKNADIKVG